jgi:DNA repair exonuclease SbcCD nuclease subunit
MLRKIAEVYEIAEREDCEFVLFGGDMFNAHRIFSYPVIGGAMDVICDSDLMTYAVVGQHEVYGYNPKTLDSSTLGFFASRCPRYQILWEPTEVGGVRLHPCHIWDDIESKEVAPESDKKDVLIAHELFSDRKRVFETVQTKDFAGSPQCFYRLVVSGDLHCGFKPHSHSGTVFANPGALARRAMDEIKREPQVAVIEVRKGDVDDVKVNYVQLDSAKPGDQVFGQTILEIVKEVGDFDAREFVSEMDNFEVEAADVHELIQRVGQEQNVRQEVLTYLSTKKREM